ncbi:hypothetical protein [Hyphomicrobium sp. ghe19]|uniref:hypothetical protein n=1 Tax=Hyphomicrobium sp. ghe19 TaxID=2682968 RepID=UPI001366B731|nr:hypothetical protein HYPP_03812 [Hyphomicrobium sp. ghe19]
MTVDDLMTEYRRLWQVFRSTPANRGPAAPPRQVCFDIDRVERELKAAGVPDPFGLVRTDRDALAFIQSASIDVADEDPPALEQTTLPTPASSQAAQLSFF